MLVYQNKTIKNTFFDTPALTLQLSVSMFSEAAGGSAHEFPELEKQNYCA